jgi:trk system potassium uptake protein TrkA
MNVIVVGGGKVGMHLAGLLLAGGHHVRVIETRAEKISLLQNELPVDAIIEGSGTDPNILESADILQTQVVAAVTGSDETNLVVTSLARFEFNVPRIIARVNNPKNAWMFTPQMGVDVALNQSDLMAHLIEEEMSLGDMMVLLKLRKGQYSLVEEKVHPAATAVGKAIRDLNLPAECVLAAIIRKGELIIPRGDTVLQPADEVLAVTHASQLAALASVLGPNGNIDQNA